MKKYNLLKVIAITILVAWVLTLIIPASYLDYSGNVAVDKIAATGIWGIFSNLGTTVSYFNGIAIFLIAVTCFYTVLNKLDVYKRFVAKTASVFENKQKLLVIITILVFGLLSALISDFMILIVLVPFIYSVMKELKIESKTILASTLISALIGSMCAIYNNSLFSLLNLKINTLLLVRVIVFVLSILVLIFFVAPKKEEKISVKKANVKESKKKSETKKVETDKNVKMVNKTVYAILTILFGTIGINKFYAGNIKSGLLRLLFCWTGIPTIISIAEFVEVLTEKSDKDGKIYSDSSKKENVIYGTLLVLFVLVTIISSLPLSAYFTKFTLFEDLNSKLADFSIFGYSIFSHIIGAPMVSSMSGSTGVLNALGSWTIADMSILLFVLTGINAIIAKVKFNDLIASLTESIKKILPIAITAVVINIVLVLAITSGITVTIVNVVTSITKGFNIATTTIATIIGSVLSGHSIYIEPNVNFYLSSVGQVLASKTSENYYGVIGFMLQSLYNLSMFVAPTSVGLVIGLYYLDIPFNKWFKYIWKVLLAIFIIVIATSIVIYILV